MLQENSPLNRLEQAVAAAERADKRLLEKPLNDLVTEIKVRGLIAKMVLVTARQTLRAVEAAEAMPVGMPKTETVAVMPPRALLKLLLTNCSSPGFKLPACDRPRIPPMPTEAEAAEVVPVDVEGEVAIESAVRPTKQAEITPQQKSVRAVSSISPDNQSLKTIEEAAAKLRKTVSWMRAHSNGSREPTIPRIKMGQGYAFDDKDLDEFLASCRETVKRERK